MAAIPMAAAAAVAFDGHGDPRVREQMRRLESEDPAERMAAATALGNMGELAAPAVPALIRACADPDAEFPAAVYEALGKIRDPRGIAPLVEALPRLRAAGRRNVFRTAAEALGKMRDVRIVRPLLESMADDAMDYHISGLQAIRAVGDPGLDVCLEVLGDASPAVRYQAGAVLAMSAPDGDSRLEAAFVLALYDANPVIQDFALNDVILRRLPDAVLMNHERAVRGILEDGDAWLRFRAAAVLARLGDVQPLLDCIQDPPEARLYRHAIHALVPHAQPEHLPLLRAQLESADEPARWEIRVALARLGDARVLDAAALAIDRGDADAVRSAVRVLMALEDRRVVPLLERARLDALGMPGALAVHYRVGEFRNLTPPQVLRELMASPESRVQLCAYSAEPADLLAAGDPAFAFLAAGLRHDDAYVRMLAAERIGVVGGARAVAALTQAMADPDCRVRQRAAHALGDVGTPCAVDVLIDALGHPPCEQSSTDFRDDIAEALYTLTGRNFGHCQDAWRRWQG